jgi:hypothetical protein
MKVIKTESKNGYVSSVLIQVEDDLSVWFDLWVEKTGTRTELTGDWNKYIFFNTSAESKRVKKFQEADGMFEKCFELAIEEYERYQEFTAEGYYTIANAGGYEVELNKDGSSARLKDSYGTENPQITDWLTVKNLEHPDMDFEVIPTIDPEGYHIPLNLVISF